MTKKKKEENINHLLGKNHNWFPGHMMKALRKIKEKIKQVDIILEVRDARSPLATSNDAFIEQVGNKVRLIVMNKTNLANPDIITLWQSWFNKKETPFLFINSFDKKSLSKITEMAKEIVYQNILKSNPEAIQKKKLKMMIIGLPNTGKSTIINKLANRDASKVADKPGQTQQQIWVKVSPELEILDTPGVMPPNIVKKEHAIWLAALHAIPERIADNEETACYIVNHLISHNPNIFKEAYKIPQTPLELIEILNAIAKVRGCIRKGNEFDYDRVYKMLIHDLRRGDLGPIHFGTPPNRQGIQDE